MQLVKTSLLLIFISCCTASLAQQVQHLTLEKAYDQAKSNYPLLKQTDLIRQTASINIENLQKNYLPQLSLNAQASYQSDVTKIDVPLPGFSIEPPSKDQYKAVADINQLVYDGGLTREQKQAARLNERVEQQKIEVEMFRLKDRINQIYFSLLYFDEQIKQVALVKTDLQTGLKQVDAQVRNGVSLKSNLNVLKAELLKADQRIIELKASRKGLLQTLSLFLKRQLDENTSLEKPATPLSADTIISRPELKLYNDQSQLLGQQVRMIQAKNLPRTSLFVQGGYGKPGLNFLRNDFDFYYIGGVRVSWALSGLYTQKKEKELVKLNQKIVDIQRENFLLNTNSDLSQQQSAIEKLSALVSSDREIIELRTQVKTAAKAQLENGVITANDYLREVNAEDQARQNQIAHELQLLQAQINYQTTLGKY